MKIEVVDKTDTVDIDEFFFSPDVGKLVRRGDLMYTEYGVVMSRRAFVRRMPVPHGSHENYADWSEEYRCRVYEAFEKKFQQEEAEEAVMAAVNEDPADN